MLVHKQPVLLYALLVPSAVTGQFPGRTAAQQSMQLADCLHPSLHVQVITPLLRILEKMHSLKLLHRDIKPENIFLTALGKFKLGDFGLAIKYDQEVAFSRSGTLDYMAPEVG